MGFLFFRLSCAHQNLVCLTAAGLGGIGALFLVRKLFSYIKNVRSSSNIMYDYEQEFRQEEHTHITHEGEAGEGDTMIESELKILQSFIAERVIPDFKEHHSEGTRHFAVLVLLDQPLLSLTKNWHFAPLTAQGRPYIDPVYNTRPPRHLYGNYVVAHPELCLPYRIVRRVLFDKLPRYNYYYNHAEAMIINEFDSLRRKFESEENRETKIVILFSRLFPCDNCTTLLIEKFGQEFRHCNPTIKRVVLTFATYWKRIPYEQNRRNFERLKESQFDIVLVKYDSA